MRTGAVSSAGPRLRSSLWILAALLTGIALQRAWDSRQAAPIDPMAEVERRTETLRDAVDRYRDDHGFYPADPSRDYNRDGDAELLQRQLTWFTRDDGKPSDRHDGDYRFGPYLRDLPLEPRSGSAALVVDQDRARALSRLRDDLAAGNGRGGWYYEARTGNIEPNVSRTLLSERSRASRSSS